MRQQLGIAARQLQLARRADGAEHQTSFPATTTTTKIPAMTSAAATHQHPPLPLPCTPPSPGVISQTNVLLNSTQLRSLFSNMICGKCMKVKVVVSNKGMNSECSVICSCEIPRTAAPPTMSSFTTCLPRMSYSIVSILLVKSLGASCRGQRLWGRSQSLTAPRSSTCPTSLASSWSL